MLNEEQISTTNSMVIRDMDLDGNDDLLLVGNFYPMEVRSIRNDAGIGAFLKGDGTGNFRFEPNQSTGLFIPGDVRHIGVLKNNGEILIVIVKNDDRPQFIKPVVNNSNF